MCGCVFIFVRVAAGEDMASHKECLHCLVKQPDALCLAMLSAWGRAEVNALRSQCRAAAVPAGMQVMEAMVVPVLPRVGAQEEEEEMVVEEDEDENMGILGGLSSGGSMAEELAGEPMEEVVEAPAVGAVVGPVLEVPETPGAYDPIGEEVPQTVEGWEEKMGGEAFLQQVCWRMGRLMGKGRRDEANALWDRHLLQPLRPKWVLVICECRRQYWEEMAEGGDEGKQKNIVLPFNHVQKTETNSLVQHKRNFMSCKEGHQISRQAFKFASNRPLPFTYQCLFDPVKLHRIFLLTSQLSLHKLYL